MAIWLRHTERERIWRLFQRGRNIALFGPRRLGKTFLMQLLAEDAPQHGYRSVFVDLASCTSPQAAITKLAESMQEELGAKGAWLQAKSRLKDLIGGDPEGNELHSALLKVDWKQLLDALLNDLDKHETKKTLILVDELSVCLAACLVRDAQSGHELLYQLRDTCKKYPNVRWFFTGSLGLDQVAEQYNLSGALNELYPFKLEPLSAEQATALTNHLCSERQLSLPDSDTHAYLQSRLNWLSPHYLTRLIDHIDENQPSGNVVDQSAVDSTCQQILEYPYNRLFSDWPDHITRNYPPESEACARDLLGILCQHADGEQRNTLNVHPDMLQHENDKLIGRTLEFLCNDGYLIFDEQSKRYRFMFGLLREYWHKKFST